MSQDRDLLLSRLPDHAVVAEIGVWKGDFSELILRACQPAQLHLIDPWTFTTAFGKRWYGGLKAKNQHDMDTIFQEVCARFADRREVKIHRALSSAAASFFPKNYFDWIYIDGNHNYEFVLQDLRNFALKLKRGGYLAGDDYYWESPEEPGTFPVQLAVAEFARLHNVDAEVIGDQYIIRIHDSVSVITP
jgi:hypothetical protein